MRKGWKRRLVFFFCFFFFRDGGGGGKRRTRKEKKQEIIKKELELILTFFVFACLLMCFCLCARDGEQRERIESGDGERKEKNGEKREKRREKKNGEREKKRVEKKKSSRKAPPPAPGGGGGGGRPRGTLERASFVSGELSLLVLPVLRGPPCLAAGGLCRARKKKKKSLSERLSLSFLSSSLSRLSLSLFSKKERHLLYFFEILLQIKSRFSGRKCFATDFFFLAVLRLSKRKKKLVVFKMARS